MSINSTTKLGKPEQDGLYYTGQSIGGVILQIEVSINLLDEMQRNSITIQINASITNLWIRHFVIFILASGGDFFFLTKSGSAVSVRPVGKRNP